MNDHSPIDLLIHICTPPTLDLEPLELGMACAAFDQQIAFVFSNDGLQWLDQQQHPRRPNGKSAIKLLNALAMYDCDQLYYLAGQQLPKDIATAVKAINTEQLQQLSNNSKHQLSF